MEQLQRGRILRARNHPSSGLMLLDLLELDSDEVVTIPCEAGPTIRAIHDAFVSQGKNPVGEVIYYEVDSLGILTGFTPGALMEKNGLPEVANPEKAGGEDPGTEPNGEVKSSLQE